MHAYCLFRAIERLCVQFTQVQLVIIVGHININTKP